MKEAKEKCAGCGKTGVVAIVTSPVGLDNWKNLDLVQVWYRLEIVCPEACDEGDLGKDNIIIVSRNIKDLKKHAKKKGWDWSSIRHAY